MLFTGVRRKVIQFSKTIFTFFSRESDDKYFMSRVHCTRCAETRKTYVYSPVHCTKCFEIENVHDLCSPNMPRLPRKIDHEYFMTQ